MAESNTPFSEKQLAEFTKLSYVAYAGAYLPASFAVEQMVRYRLREFAPEQEIVWGPVALKSNLWDMYTVALVFVVKRIDPETNKETYTTVFRGTNPLSWTSVLIQDMALRHQVPWTVASPYSSKKSMPVDPGASIISAGANVTLNKLKMITDGGKTLVEFLSGVLSDTDADVCFTGHSLGGLSAMMFPLLLINQCLANDIEVKDRLSIGALAAPTAGDVDFAAYTDALYTAVNCKYQRIVNVLDLVNLTWSEEAIASDLAGLYLPSIIPTMGDKILINSFYNLANDCDYQQPNPKNTYQFSLGVMEPPATIFSQIAAGVAEHLFPSGEWPYTWYAQSLAQHALAYAEYFLDEDTHHNVKTKLGPELAFINDGHALTPKHFKNLSAA